MATTRLKVSSQTIVYHRFASSNDAPQTDVGTDEVLASKLGGVGDFQLQADDDLTYTSRNGVVADSGDFAASAGSIANGFYYILHTGFQESAKTTATTSYLKMSLGQATSATDTFSIYPGESMIFHAPFGAGLDDAADYVLKSSSGNIFVEVITAV